MAKARCSKCKQMRQVSQTWPPLCMDCDPGYGNEDELTRLRKENRKLRDRIEKCERCGAVVVCPDCEVIP